MRARVVQAGTSVHCWVTSPTPSSLYNISKKPNKRHKEEDHSGRRRRQGAELPQLTTESTQTLPGHISPNHPMNSCHEAPIRDDYPTQVLRGSYSLRIVLRGMSSKGLHSFNSQLRVQRPLCVFFCFFVLRLRPCAVYCLPTSATSRSFVCAWRFSLRISYSA